ncbi:PPE domain-containing protein [Mycobacterium tuberculosis]|nr:PPE domain-containing protein [Mycobacterium tuberculosis]
MFFGAGSGPMLAAAAAWDGLAAELGLAAESFGLVTSGLAGGSGQAWQGAAAAAMVVAAAPYAGWLAAAAARAGGLRFRLRRWPARLRRRGRPWWIRWWWRLIAVRLCSWCCRMCLGRMRRRLPLLRPPMSRCGLPMWRRWWVITVGHRRRRRRWRHGSRRCRACWAC